MTLTLTIAADKGLSQDCFEDTPDCTNKKGAGKPGTNYFLKPPPIYAPIFETPLFL